MPEAVVVSAVRSPIGRAFKGSLADMRPDDLAAQMVNAALAAIPELDPNTVDDLLLGCASPAGLSGHNLARVVAVLAGLDTVAGTTVNRYCSSSLQTTRMAFHAIKAGEGDVFIAAGVETVSQFPLGTSDTADAVNPRFRPAQERTTERATLADADWTDPRTKGQLPDIYIQMGQTAENVAALQRISRSEQDDYAALSQNRAEESIASGFWAADITAVQLPNGDLVTADDCPRAGTTVEGLSGLKSAFRPGGTVTAGNACPLNDGAAALIIMSDTKARQLGLSPLARILSTGVSALSPEIMGLGPIEATRRALDYAGMTIEDIDLVEMNEAFAAQVIPSARELSIDIDKLNVHGGSIAVGHPFGMTGARIATTLIHALQSRDKQVGLETMCVGGGQGMAMVIERLI